MGWEGGIDGRVGGLGQRDRTGLDWAGLGGGRQGQGGAGRGRVDQGRAGQGKVDWLRPRTSRAHSLTIACVCVSKLTNERTDEVQIRPLAGGGRPPLFFDPRGAHARSV